MTKARAVVLLSCGTALTIVSAAILTRDRPGTDPDASRQAASTTANEISGFSISADDDLNFRVLRDGEPILIMTDGYRARFRCNPTNDHWIGTRRTPVHLGWSPWDAADVADVSVHRVVTADHFELRITATKPQLDNTKFTTTLIGDRDLESGRITYGLVSELHARPVDVKKHLDASRIEYLDPWIEGVFWHERDNHDRELYHSFVFFDAEAQTLTRTPKLHLFPCLRDGTYETLVTPMTSGAFALVDDIEPGLRFLVADLTGPGTLGICWWTWDPHFYLDLDGAIGDSLRFAMRIEEISVKSGARMIADAVPIPFETDPEHQVPTFVRDSVNRFDDMLDKPDEWSWEQYSTACEIDRRIGFDDNVSVTIHGKDKQTSAWYARTIGYDYFDHARLQDGQSVTTMIRTEGTREGARLGVLCYNGPESWLYEENEPVTIWSEPVTGTSDWQLRTVKFDASGFKRFKIVLEHSGGGQSWFDNVELKRDPSADGAGWHDDVVDWRDRDWSQPQELPRRAFKCSRPQMRNDPERIVMAWKDCSAAGPRLRLPEGEFLIRLDVSGDGCEDDLPVLEASTGDVTAAHPIKVAGRTTVEWQFVSDGNAPMQLRLKFANDGICSHESREIDKNIFIHRIDVRRAD